MPPEVTSETKFAFESFLSLPTVILVALVLLAVSFWMSRRDARFVERRKWAWLLLCLRGVAIVILVWMLAGPTLVTTLHRFKRKSVAILVDASASMGLVDVADGSGNASRWDAAHRDSRDARQLQQLDSAAATLLAAQRQLERFARISDSTRDGAAARRLFAKAVTGLSQGVDLIKSSSGNLPGSAAELKRALIDAVKPIENVSLQTLPQKAAEFSSGKSLAALERKQWLPKQLEQLSLAVGAIETLADQFSKSREKEVATPGASSKDEAKASRLDNVAAFMTSAENGWLKELAAKANVNRYEFGEKVVPVGTLGLVSPGSAAAPRPLSPATQLGTALEQVALDNTTQPLEAAILITDGGQNAGRDPRELAPSLAGTTLHIVPIGNTKMERDVILHHTHAPKAALQNDTVVVDSVVTAYGCEHESLQIELLAGNSVIEQQTLNVTSGVFDTHVRLRWKASKLGKQTLSVRVLPVSGERDEENNTAKADIQVMEEKVRVLVADNFPRWETRYLLNLFKRDERVTFEQLLFEPQRTSGEGVRTSFPASLEEWSKYRVIILGDVLPSQLKPEQQKLLREYVTETGGNLIMVAGKDAMPAAYLNQPLGALLPVQAGDRALPANNPFYLHVADEDSQTLATQIAENPAASERVWREMSERVPLYGLSEFSKPKSTTHTLIWTSKEKSGFDPRDASTRSFLSWHFVGAGRVVYLAAPLTYQLRYREGDTFHHRFWGQLLRWVVARDLAEGSLTVRLSTDKLRYEVGEPVQVSAQLRQLDGKVVTGAALQIEASQHGAVLQNVALTEDASRPGSYHAVLPQTPAGQVKLQIRGDRVNELLASENYSRAVETTVDIDPNAMLELRHPLCNMPLLREIADASSGLIVPPTGLEAALRQLNFDPEVSENISKKPLWNRWDLFCLFIACLSLEWAGRKYLGLS
jgi:hypothetical protein